MSSLNKPLQYESARYVGGLTKRPINHQKPPKSKKLESVASISFAHDSEFLRTSSNMDMFTIDNGKISVNLRNHNRGDDVSRLGQNGRK